MKMKMRIDERYLGHPGVVSRGGEGIAAAVETLPLCAMSAGCSERATEAVPLSSSITARRGRRKLVARPPPLSAPGERRCGTNPLSHFALIWFLLAEEAAYMTGQAINLTGGLVTW
jgi:hypothetical protein